MTLFQRRCHNGSLTPVCSLFVRFARSRFKPQNRSTMIVLSDSDILCTDEGSQTSIEVETTPSEECPQLSEGQKGGSFVQQKILRFESMKKRESIPAFQHPSKRIKIDHTGSVQTGLPSEDVLIKSGTAAASIQCPSGNVLLATENLETNVATKNERTAQSALLKKGTDSSTIKDKRVRWSTVDIRFYDTVLVTTPAGGVGPKVGISCQHFKKCSLTIDHYEKIRPLDERRSMWDLHIHDHQRYEMLVAKGYTSCQIYDSIHEAWVIQKQRQDTIDKLRWMPLQDFLERFVAFAKMPLKNVRRRTHKEKTKQ